MTLSARSGFLIGLLAMLPPVAGAIGAEPDRAWVGINPGHGSLLADPAYAEAAARETVALGLGLTRIGIDGVGGATAGAAFDWEDRDRAVGTFLAVGIEVRAVVSFREHIEQEGDAAANWRYFVGEVARHYRGRIFYYIIDNEPDLAGVPPELAVERACAAYREIKAVDPSIRVESPPTASAGAGYLAKMIALGVTRCADVLGVHSYGGQLDEGHRHGLDRPWRFMARSGHPVIPVADSEGGNSHSWAPRGAPDPTEWQARWYRLAWLQHKRYGYDSLMLFSLRSPKGLWDVASWRDGRLVPNDPVYQAVLSYRRRPFADGGFERATAPGSPWIVVESIEAPEPDAAENVDLAAPEARSGARALRTSGPARVRQVAEHLTPGRPVTLAAWVRVEHRAVAQLKALGFNHLAGNAEVVAATEGGGRAWRRLELEVVPSRTWVVVSLEADGAGAVTWDDVELTVR